MGPQSPADDGNGAAFRVLVRGSRNDKLWGHYSDRTEAQAATSRLRAIGLDARVELIDRDPEAA